LHKERWVWSLFIIIVKCSVLRTDGGLSGIAVSSTPVAVNNATADVGIFLLIGALRQAYVPLAAIRTGLSMTDVLISYGA
jgi:hypothetical protein